jgi:hypothetical protein
MHCGARGATSNAAGGFCAEVCACRSDPIPVLPRRRFRTDDFSMKHLSPAHFGAPWPARTVLPNRPDACVLNRAIPLFFVGRNKHGFWLVREAQGRIGGMFLLRRSALRFAQRASAPHGCATMLVAKTFELDTWNRGNPLVGRLDAALRLLSQFIPDYPPPIPITEKYRRRDWL